MRVGVPSEIQTEHLEGYLWKDPFSEMILKCILEKETVQYSFQLRAIVNDEGGEYSGSVTS
jgi:hypothetical protein